MASLEDLRLLRENMSFLRQQIIEFNCLCNPDDGGFRSDLAKIPTQDQRLRNNLGEDARKAMKERGVLDERLNIIKEIDTLQG